MLDPPNTTRPSRRRVARARARCARRSRADPCARRCRDNRAARCPSRATSATLASALTLVAFGPLSRPWERMTVPFMRASADEAAIVASPRVPRDAAAACDTSRMPAPLMIQDWPLPYEARLDERPASAVDLVVVHCTELPDLKLAREFGEKVRYRQRHRQQRPLLRRSRRRGVPLRRRHARREPDVRLQHALDRHRAGQSRPLSVLERHAGTRRSPSRIRRSRSTRCARCSASCATICRTCARSPATRISIAGSNPPATIRRSCCRGDRIRARCFRGIEVLDGSGLERLASQRSIGRLNPLRQRRYTARPSAHRRQQ